ncbi:TPA: CPBP family intramembrane metalloprotease [Staphylococcus aureus]|nr:CPBP family intramembrane metalloprotease [Staphylococcus aureus]
MTRLWASLLTVIIYILSQFLPLLIVKKLSFVQYSGIELTKAVIYIQLVLFLIAATTIILINLKIKNPTKLELEVKEPKKYIIPWALLGFALVMIYQMVVSIVYTQIFGTQQTSPNTERLIVIARKIPLFIFFVSIVGPLLEEYVFRKVIFKVIFGELFNAIKGNRIVAFAIATTVSSLIFALAHNDYKFIPIYFGMGVIFSLAYVWTKRLAVPIIIHMLQNGFVVIFQLLNPEALKKATEQANFIYHIFIP